MNTENSPTRFEEIRNIFDDLLVEHGYGNRFQGDNSEQTRFARHLVKKSDTPKFNSLYIL